jgi:hypothetical protein
MKRFDIPIDLDDRYNLRYERECTELETQFLDLIMDLFRVVLGTQTRPSLRAVIGKFRGFPAGLGVAICTAIPARSSSAGVPEPLVHLFAPNG